MNQRLKKHDRWLGYYHLSSLFHILLVHRHLGLSTTKRHWMLDDVGCLSSPDTTALCVRTWTILQKTTHYQTWPLPDHKLLGQVVKKNKKNRTCNTWRAVCLRGSGISYFISIWNTRKHSWIGWVFSSQDTPSQNICPFTFTQSRKKGVSNCRVPVTSSLKLVIKQE